MFPVNCDFIFLIRKETRIFFQRLYCGLPLRSFYYFSRGQDALAVQRSELRYFPIFCKSKIDKTSHFSNFGDGRIKVTSFDHHHLLPHISIINPSLSWKKKKTTTKNTSRKLLRKNGSFHHLIFAFWSPLELLALALIAAMDGVFLKLLQPWCGSKKCE